MRLARVIATFFLLGMILLSNFRQPVRAISCQDECANTYTTCNTQVANDYYTCIEACDTLYPWWSGCPNYCLSARDAGWAQCESDYNSCLAGCP